MTQSPKKNNNSGKSFTPFEQAVIDLLTKNNKLLSENNDLLRKDREAILRIEEYARGIRSNTSGFH